ncbi:MAG: peptidylprolyl isomerase [Prevotella sp.]|nr:peptidylprolyl isomerase [Prevotella sp.]MDD7096439.1 peptidylprolyl isomerase [Prevotellaceae bacterium]MDY5249580.1 peptidylprolyl isomerase [Prevotella sp.]
MRKIFALLMIIMTSTMIYAQDKRRVVMMQTTAGNIRIELYNETPLHRDNFVRLVNEHFYDSLLFHRVIKSFMIQAGDPVSRHAQPGVFLGDSTLNYTIPAEIRTPQIYHKRGAVAMAREPDEVNPEQKSSSCQFYIVWGKRFSSQAIERVQERLDTIKGGIKLTDEMISTYRKTGGTPHLDGTYTVFGEVTEGLDVIERIQAVMTDDDDRPVDDQRILKAIVVE